MEEARDIPRWARPLGRATWERINELLAEGWDAADVMRELKVPESKRRSLQSLAHKYGPRRRLAQFARFKDALLSGAVDMGPDFAKAMTLIAHYAVGDGVKLSSQRRACELMNKFARTLARVMTVDELAEKERKRDEAAREQGLTASEAVRRVMAQYGVAFDGKDEGASDDNTSD